MQIPIKLAQFSLTVNSLGLLLCLLQATGLTALMAKLTEIIGNNQSQNSDQRSALA